MRLSFQSLAPAAEPWLERLAQAPLIKQVNETVWVFAAIETGHLLSLAILGGAVLALALRLLGLALTGIPAAEVERRTRPWLHVGVIGALSTGVIMAVINVTTLYPSSAFFVKMVALVAAILFSYAVVREVVRGGDRPSSVAIGLAVAALAVWAVSLLVFVATPRVNPGAVLVLAAGIALLGAAAKRHRWLLLGGLAAIVLVGWFVTHVALAAVDTPATIAWTNIGFVAAAFVFTLGVGALEIRAGGAGSEIPAKLAGFASALAWVTVAGAGRWIGFS